MELTAARAPVSDQWLVTMTGEKKTQGCFAALKECQNLHTLKLYREGVLHQRARRPWSACGNAGSAPRVRGEPPGGRARILPDGTQGCGLEFGPTSARITARGLVRLGRRVLQRLQSPLHFLPE